MHKKFYIVAGLGKTGKSMANFLKRRHEFFVFFDTRIDSDIFDTIKQEFAGIQFFFQAIPQEIYSQCKAILLSPGIDLDEIFLKDARMLSIPIYGDIECFAREVKVPVIAITGTNGKSTVTTLMGEIAKASGFNVAVAGNIGNPVLDQLDDGNNYNLWVVELSSFQLDLVRSLQPLAATILNITDDHLDRHHTMSAYISAKQNIYTNASYILYNRQDSNTYPQQLDKNTTIISYGLDAPSNQQWGIIDCHGIKYIAHGKNKILPVARLSLKGQHNWLNAIVSCALASLLDIKYEQMIAVLTQFAGLAHRCQLVKNFNDVTWINDSKGTNIGATISALIGIGEDISGKIVLIAGGLGKGADFTQLQPSLANYVRIVILFGTDANKIAVAIDNIVPIIMVNSLEEAVIKAKFNAKPQDVVLLSPACSSLDMFQDFNHRGEVFTNLVNNLT